MKKCFVLVSFIILIIFILFLSTNCQKKAALDTYEEVLKAFQNPPAEFRSAPLWVWNDRITREQIDGQLADFNAHGLGGVFIHPRPGLITPYLSEEWLDLCRHAVEKGKSLGLKVWLYDENSYPSGFAGGHVPAQMPDAVRQGLRMTRATEWPVALELEEPPILVLEQTASGFKDITQEPRSQKEKGNYCLFHVIKQSPSPWYGGFTYVDLMRREVTEKFLDITLNAYKSAIGSEFGSTVPGVFQDEAEIGPPWGKDVVNYSPMLFEAFQSKWGYDLRLVLPSLFEETGDWKRVRHNYYTTLLELFVKGWAILYYEYCSAHDLIFTGHYWEHEWPIPRLSPDNMAMYAYAHMPGIDCLMNEWQTGPHAQFGNARAVKEVRSVANQLGKLRTLSETYGASGWDLTFFDQKRIGDWEYALGVNFLNQHLSYVTIKGARKRDHPLSFSYHEPWWHAYRLLADYFGRLSVALARGKQENKILVLEPTTTAWIYYSSTGQTEPLSAVGDEFQNFVNFLEREQVEYDLGSEAILAGQAKVKGKELIVGNQSYKLIILAPGLENLNEETAILLKDYVRRGGKIISWQKLPVYIDGRETDQFAELQTQYKRNWEVIQDQSGWEKIDEICAPGIAFKNPDQIPGLLFHHRRLLKDGELIFLANISDKSESAGQFTFKGRSCEKWDPFTGNVSPFPFKNNGGKLEIHFTLPPGGSLLLCIRPVQSKSAANTADSKYTWEELLSQDELRIKPLALNVLTLDYCDLVLGKKAERDLYFYDAQLKTFQHHGLSRNPWDSAVQFKTNIIDQNKFSPDSGFEATYWFTITPGVNRDLLDVVVERPELYHVFINNNTVEPLKDRWWLDRAFGVFAIGQEAREGKNKITLRARPFTIHTELEPVYVLGDFRLKSEKRGFEIVPSTELELGGWPSQGMPFYSAGVSYEKTYEIQSLNPEKERYVLKLGSWKGAVAEVLVGEKTAGFIAFQPYSLDITGSLGQGLNRVSVIVYGTLKNTLGPHHNNPPPGRAWPGSFQKGAAKGLPPGAEYSVIDYGLMDDFKLLVKTKQ